MKNKSLHAERVFDENALHFTEVIRQKYNGNNCVISAGYVEGESKPKVDTIYLRFEKDHVEPTVLLLWPDEAQAIAWVALVVWSGRTLWAEKKRTEWRPGE